MTFTDLLLAVPFPHLTVFSHGTPEAVFVNSFRLPPEASVYTAESTAIHRALRIVGPKTRRLVCLYRFSM